MAHQSEDTTTSLLGSLLHISIAINAQLELPAILAQVITATRHVTGCSDACLVLWDADHQRFVPGASTANGCADEFCLPEGLSHQIVQWGRVYLVQDTAHDPFLTTPSSCSIGAYAGVPLKHGSESLGVLYALSREPRRFDQGELPVMQALAEITSVAVRNAQMVQALQEMNAFKHTMLQLAAHDLRNPLMKAMGYFDLLLYDAGELDPCDQEYAAVVRNSLRRAETLIAGILASERVSSGRMECEPHDVNRLVQEVAVEFRSAAEAKAQQLSVCCQDAPVVTVCDGMLFQQAIGNLVSNAIKYTPANGEITLRTELLGDDVVVSVQDTGPGIPPEEQTLLFQPFRRLSSAGAETGSGLGLSMVKTIIERHGGRVSVQSSPEHGTCFAITVPAASEVG